MIRIIQFTDQQKQLKKGQAVENNISIYVRTKYNTV